MLKKIKDKMGLVVIGSFVLVSLLSLVQLAIVPLLTGIIASVVSAIVAFGIISIVLTGLTITSIYNAKEIIKSIKEGKPLDEFDIIDIPSNEEIKEEKIYKSLSNDNQKIYLDIIKNNRDDSLFESFNSDLIRQIISTCDSEIEWYINVASKRGASDKEQKMVIDAISLKNKAINYVNENNKEDIQKRKSISR